MVKEPDSRLKILPADLDDREHDLYRVNQVVSDLYTKIDTLRFDGKFYGRSQFEDIVLNTDRDPSTLGDTEVLNLGEIRRLGLSGGSTVTRVVSGGGGGGGGGVGGSITVQYPPATSYLDAVSRILSEKVGETISVLDFGATADGSTDDSPAFNRAITAAIRSGRGKRILIPACANGKYYKLDSKLQVNNRYYLNGTVDTSGTTVTWSSGDEFPAYLGTGEYTTITINGNDYTIASRDSSTQITLTSVPAGDPLTGVAFLTMGDSWIPIQFDGEGDLSLVVRGGTLGAGEGLFDVKGKDIVFTNFCVDGAVTTPTGLQYGSPGDFNNDPMNSALTTNTSFWIHGPSENVTFWGVTVQHTGGYSILVDATNGSNAYDANPYDIRNTKVLYCKFLNNRPHLFGNGGPAEYGSWTGGVFLNTYGVQDASNYLSTVYNTLIEGCYFIGNTGNCVWSHLYGFDILFSDVRTIGNTFIDNGLDGILYGGVAGGTATANRFRRIGYIATDTSQDVSVDNPTTPKWLLNLNATALDTSGICKNVSYSNNTFISTNGGDMDLDGFCDGQVVGNVCFTPRSYDPEYVEDSIALTGPPGYPGKYSYGIQPSNTYGQQWGAVNVSITGNSFINKDGGAIRLAACRGCYVSSNNINHPSGASYPPIILFNIGTGSTQRTYDTVVATNSIQYDPGSQVASIQEWGAALGYPAFQAGDKNWIHGNQIIGNSYEFYKDADTDSTTGITVSMSKSALSSRSNTFIERLRSTTSGLNFDYLKFSYDNTGTLSQTAYLSDHSIRGISGYVNTSGTSVSWVSGDDFSSFANGGSIVINGITYTISTVNSSISITLTGSAGTQSAVTFGNPLYKQGYPLFNVGDGTSGSITTGSRSILGFDDVMATNVLSGDGFLMLTDASISNTKADKLSDSYGLLKYDSTAKVFKISNSTASGVRVWSTLGSGGGSPGGADKYVQINDSGSFGGFSSFTFDKSTKLLTLTGVASTPTILAATGYIQSNGGFLSQVDAYNAFQATFGDGAYLYGMDIADYYPNGYVDTSGTSVTRVSGSPFTSGMAGNLITINGVTYAVATFVDANNLTLTSSAGTQSNKSYFSLVGNRGGYLRFRQLTTGTYPSALTGTSFSGDPMLWAGSSNGTPTPVSSVGLNTNAYINAAAGFYSANTATDTIQAPYGGLYGKWLIAGNSTIWISVPSGTVNTSGTSVTLVTGSNFLGFSVGDTIKINGTNYTVLLVNSATSITLTGSAGTQSGVAYRMVPAVSSIGQARIYLEPSTGLLMASQNGSAYTTLIGTSPTGSDGYIQYYYSGSLSSNANLFYDTVKGFTSLGGETASANITARLYVRGAGHFWSDTASDTIVLSKATTSQTGNHFEAQSSTGTAFWAISPSGGMYFRTNGTPTGGSGLGLIYFDGSKLKAQEGTGSVVDLIGSASPAGSDGYIQYKSSTSFAANINLYYDIANGFLSLGGTTAGLTARLYVRGAAHVWADNASQTIVLSKGTTSQSGNHFEAQTNAGTAIWAISPNAGMYFRNNGTPTASSGTGLIYFDGTNFKYYEGTSGPFSFGGGVTSLNTRTGAITISAGSGISVTSPTSSSIVISNSGVTSLAAGTGVSVSASSGSVTVSIGQSVSTSATPTFAGMNFTSSSYAIAVASNTLFIDNQDATGGDIYLRPRNTRFVVIGASSGNTGGLLPYGGNMTLGNSSNNWAGVYGQFFYVNSTQVIDSSRNVIANRFYINNGVTTYTGQNWKYTFNSGTGKFDIYDSNSGSFIGSFTYLIHQGGILVSASN